MKLVLMNLTILILVISAVGMAETTGNIAPPKPPSPIPPTAKECKAAVAANSILMPDDKYSPYVILIQLRQKTFGSPVLDESMSPKDETKVEKERRESQNQINATDFENKLAVLNDIRKSVGLKVLSLSDVEWEPEMVYKSDPKLDSKLDELRKQLNKQKSEVDRVILACFQAELQKAFEDEQKKEEAQEIASQLATKHATVGEKLTPKAMVSGNPPAQSKAKACADVIATPNTMSTTAPPPAGEISQRQL